MKKKLRRVRFVDASEKKTMEVVVEKISSSELMGMVVLEGFVFSDQKKLVILPEEEAARQRFCKTERLHIPYHSIIYCEEFDDEPADLKHLPFIREVMETPERSPHSHVDRLDKGR